MASTLGDMVVKIVADATQFNKAIDDSEKKMLRATKVFEGLGKKLTTFVTLPILGIGAASVKAAADMEMQQAAFETMLGSAEKAKKLLYDLNQLAASTPFQMTDLADATRTMLAFGIENEKVLPNLKMLGDIAGGNADKLKTLTLAFSQIQSTGRLMGQDLLQLVNAGFNPLSIIAEKTGKTMGELKKEMEKGAISADMVSDAFKTATSEGGLFFGGMERASTTFNGLVSTLVDNVVMLGKSIGDEMLPKLKEIVATLTEWVGKFTSLDSATKQAIIQYGLLAAAIGPVILGVVKLIQVIPTLKIALAALTANPIILAMIGLAAAIAVVAVESKKAATQAKAMKDALSGAAELQQIQWAIEAKAKEIEAQKTLIKQNEHLYEMGILDREAAKTNLDLLERERRTLVDNYNGRQANIRATEAMASAETKRIEAELAAAKKSLELSATMTDEEIKAAEANLKIWEDMYEARLQAEANARGDAIVEEAKQLEEIEKMERESAERIKQTKIDIVSDGVKVLLSSLSEVGAALVEGEDLWSVFGKAGLNAIASMLDAIGALMAGYAAAGVAASFFSLGASAVPVPVAIAGAAAAYIAAGAVRAAATKLADGGIVMPKEGGTLAQIAEAGQPEAVIPLDKLGGIGGDIHLVVQMDSKPFLDKIFPATRDRTILISAGAVV